MGRGVAECRGACGKVRSTLDNIENPKRARSIGSLFDYYAGYSEGFVGSVINQLGLPNCSIVVDPWNGSGTTTTMASSLGSTAYGFDLNPAMIVVAKLNAISFENWRGLKGKFEQLIESIDVLGSVSLDPDDPLLTWFYPTSASYIRAIELSVKGMVIEHLGRQFSSLSDYVENIPDWAAFFYVALFKVVRLFMERYRSSNPTWIKKPKNPQRRSRPSVEVVRAAFVSAVEMLEKDLARKVKSRLSSATTPIFGCSSSRGLPVGSEFADAVITSPPYCTRIDYVVATYPELAVLGCKSSDIKALRSGMIGTPTVYPQSPQSFSFSDTLETMLKQVSNHESKASGSYYYKNLVQYFTGIVDSLEEISRILKPEGVCVLVVQDSYYKDIHLDLSGVFSDVAGRFGLVLLSKKDFSVRSFGWINSRSRQYGGHKIPTESVLFLERRF